MIILGIKKAFMRGESHKADVKTNKHSKRALVVFLLNIIPSKRQSFKVKRGGLFD